MKEFLNSLFQSSSERIKNPFIFSFIFSSIFFNWKTILTLLYSSKTIEDRIEYVSSCYVNINISLYYPLLFSLFYIILLPYLMWLFEKIVENIDNFSNAELEKSNQNENHWQLFLLTNNKNEDVLLDIGMRPN